MNQQEKLLHPETEQKINELLAQMTLSEKIGQLNQVGPSPVGGFEISLGEIKKMYEAGRISRAEYDRQCAGIKWDNHEDEVREGKIGSFLGIRSVEKCNRMQRIAVEQSRLGIPLLIGLDVVHGLRTIFPIPLAESCTWDEALFEKSASIAAKEAAATGINWTFAPMVDIARDARWGRIAEGAGEDTYLTSRFAAAKVRGFQGEDMSQPDKIVSCAKHFVAYGAAVGGRDYNSADMSEQTLWETYMPPFEAAAKAGVATVMSAFNDLNGVPCTTNSYLLDDVLRKQWSFNGMVVSDAGSIGECVAHGNVVDRRQASVAALSAGLDMDMGSFCYTEELEELVKSRKISMEMLDDAVRRVLRIKFAAGLFEHPYVDETLGERLYLCDEHRQATRDIARRSIVLLKNNGLLPLRPSLKLAVVGKLADNAKEMIGTWGGMGREEDTVSLLQGLRSAKMAVTYYPCCGVDDELCVEELDRAIAENDVVIAAVGEWADMSGEASSLCHIGLHGEQDRMIELLKESGKPFVAVLFNGRPLAISELVDSADAVVEAWHLGSEAGNAIADVLLGEYNPSGRLTTTFPYYSGQCPLYYNHVPTGRPTSDIRHTCKYMDAPLTPLFPFGYGLSYTEYTYKDLQVKVEDEQIVATVTVKNEGTVAGEETVQLYVRDELASRVRPVRELKAFTKVWLQPSEEKTVTLTVQKADLGYYDAKMHYVVESGEFTLWVGHDSTAALNSRFVLS